MLSQFTHFAKKLWTRLSHAANQLFRRILDPWISLSAFYRWASGEFEFPNPMLQVAKPKYVVKPVELFTREDVAALLKACTVSREVQPTDRRAFVMRPYEADRNQTIILTLLDTGLRAGELCALNIGDYVEQTGKLEVKHGRSGGSKGRKGRLVYLSKAARARCGATWPSARIVPTRTRRCSWATTTGAWTAMCSGRW